MQEQHKSKFSKFGNLSLKKWAKTEIGSKNSTCDMTLFYLCRYVASQRAKTTQDDIYAVIDCKHSDIYISYKTKEVLSQQVLFLIIQHLYVSSKQSML